MELLLAFVRSQSAGCAIALSLLANVVVFVATLAVGALVTRVFGGRRVARQAPPTSREEIGLAAACVVLNAAVMLAGWELFRVGILVADPGSSGWRWLADAFVLLLVMDVAMYGTHRLAHVPVLYRWVHRVHHRYDRPRPLTLFVLHPIEVLGFGGLWIAVLCTHAFSLGGMLVYLTANTLFGVLGHVGVEPLPRAWARWPVLRRIGTSTFHARHHQDPTSNYGFYSTVWDRLLGTLDPSYATRFGTPPDP